MLPLKGHDSEESDIPWPLKRIFPTESSHGLCCTTVFYWFTLYSCIGEQFVLSLYGQAAYYNVYTVNLCNIIKNMNLVKFYTMALFRNNL